MTQKLTILFDLDGTLVDTAPDLMGAHNHVMKKFGFEQKRLRDIKHLAGRGAWIMMQRSFREEITDEKMKKELRVTVIATGFEDKDAEIKNEIEKITRGLKPNVYDIPTHVRLNKNNKPKVKPVNQDFMFMDEAIDTPTFLRRAAD